MLPPRLPRIVDIRKLAAHGGRLRGSIALADLERLRAELRQAIGEIAVDLAFATTLEGVRRVEGSIELVLALNCQRCLGSLELPLRLAVAADLVDDEDALEALPSARDGWIVAPEDEDLYALVEDEIFLALPFAPSHADGQCEVQQPLHQDERNADSAEQQHPFAVLVALKKPAAPADGH